MPAVTSGPIDTIFALSSAPGKAGVAVIRVSGPASWRSLKKFCSLEKDPLPRRALFKPVIDTATGSVLDHALILPFRGPSSFTGEDIVEYHLHGSVAIIKAFLGALGREAGHRLAEPGEFTRRAFENEKMDLTAAEAIGDLIDAETEMQRQQALRQMGGALHDLYNGWREKLIRAAAYIEAVIDFPDEEVPDSAALDILPQLEELLSEIGDHLNDNRRGERLRSGVQIAVIGAPNAGKSSLINQLAQRDVAIVSPLAGTTRDIIETHLDLGGYPVIIADTAGLRPENLKADGQEGIEAEGIKRAIARAREADIRILMFDGTVPPDKNTLSLANEHSIYVFNKCDETSFLPLPPAMSSAVCLSAKTGHNISEFLDVLTARIEEIFVVSRETPSLTRNRHRLALEACRGHIEQAIAAHLPELMAEDLRIAGREIGRITGRVDVEDLLDVIFRDFCIGK